MAFKPVRQGAGFPWTLHPACEALSLASLHQTSTGEPHLSSEVADSVRPLDAGVQGGDMRMQGGLLALCGAWTLRPAQPGRALTVLLQISILRVLVACWE